MRGEAAAVLPHLRLVGPAGRTSPGASVGSERGLRRVITMLWVAVALLTMVGLVMVLSASSVTAFAEYGSSFLFFQRQAVYALFGGLVALAAARLPYRLWQRAWVPLLGVSLLLLVLVLHPSVGTVAGGAARWIRVGELTLQPSELVKFAVVAAVASVLAANLRTLHTEPGRWVVPLLVIVGAASLLILLQPDLGTMIVIAITAFLLLFVAGVRLRHLFLSAVMAGSAGMALILMESYRRARFLSYLDPWSDPSHTGYQIVQSLIALGSGRLVGVGLGASRQKWMYVPNAHTDFIFSIMGEELGLAGEVVILALFAALVYAGIRIAMAAPDAFGRLLAAGITAWLGFQALLNLGAVTGLLPITGVPLPFVSFGGSALVVSLGAVGVLISVGRAAVARPRPVPAKRAPRRGAASPAERRRR
jgi:cell division protein FtsW